MNKTVTANISGIIFNVEEEAYQKLGQYLNTIRSYFKNSEGNEEIMADIEARVAELFQERISGTKQVIVMKDVEEVIAIMGQPEQYIDEDLDEEASSSGSESAGAGSSRKTRRIFRNPDNHIIGGVCGGISAHFGWDPLWLRILFALLFFTMGTGILLYIFLWIVLPEAKTTADKLEMMGDPVNVENIGTHIKENIAKPDAEKAKTFIHSFFNTIGHALGKFFAIFGRVIGVAFIGMGIFLSYALIMIWLGSESMISFTQDGITSINFDQFINMIFPSTEHVFWAYVGVTMVIGVPIMALLYTGIKLVLDIRQSYKGVAITFLSLWIIGFMVCGIIAMQTVSNFASGDEYVTEEIHIEQPVADTLIIAVTPDAYFSDHYDHYDENLELIRIEDESIVFGYPELDVRPSYDTLYHLEITTSSCGRNTRGAIDRIEHIEYHFEQSDSLLLFDPYFTAPLEDQWRCQQVEITVYVPEGKAVYLDESANRIIYNIRNVHHMDDRRMPGHTWEVKKDGLTCTDCGL